MAKTALNQLQEQIDAVRREAFAAGYAAAMQSIREFAARPAPTADAAAAAAPRRGRRGRPPRQAAPPAPPARQRRTRRGAPATTRPARATGRRPQRGTNARLIEEVLQAAAPRAVRPAEIRKALRDQGHSMAFTSIRHALGQLEARHTAEQVGDTKTWRYLGSSAS